MGGSGQIYELLKRHWEKLQRNAPRIPENGALIQLDVAKRAVTVLTMEIADYRFGLEQFLAFWGEGSPGYNDGCKQKAIKEHDRLMELIGRLRDDSPTTLRQVFPPDEVLTNFT